MNASAFFQEAGLWGIIITGMLMVLSIIGGIFLVFYMLFVFLFGAKQDTSSIEAILAKN
jgi:heme/copper-type cytochrome/quinol oxidase subunit 2